uniref:Uncharacterized protein n=1 Tax=Anguilla anguilla TaxID=7936 RepID=A0A0E9U0H7_ANGAN
MLNILLCIYHIHDRINPCSSS